MTNDDDDGYDELALERRWPLAPSNLLPRERWRWSEQLWADVATLRNRYRLPLRSGW